MPASRIELDPAAVAQLNELLPQAVGQDQSAFAEAVRAVEAAATGDHASAATRFHTALKHTNALIVLQLAFEYFFRADELDEAERIARRWIETCGEDNADLNLAAAYGNLASVYQARQALDSAEQYLQKSLAIEETLQHKEGMASDYGNLGCIYLLRGDLDRAEQLLIKAVQLEEELGRNVEASSFRGNLALIRQQRGELEEAQRLLEDAIAVFLEHGQLEHAAMAYGNLGGLYEQEGDNMAAVEAGHKARSLFAELDNTPRVEQLDRWLQRIKTRHP